MAEPISGAEPSSPPGPAMTPFPALHPRAQPQAQPHCQGHSGSLYCPRGRPPEPWQLEVGVCCPQAGGRGSGLLWHRWLHALGQVCAGGDRPGPLLSPGCRVGLVLVEHPSLLTACHKRGFPDMGVVSPSWWEHTPGLSCQRSQWGALLAGCGSLGRCLCLSLGPKV